jgi:signal transduction histidine kinase/CheY-like chemotaxis protein
MRLATSNVVETPLRRRLFVLIAAGVLPLECIETDAGHDRQRQQRYQAQQVALELSRSVANAVDSELRSAAAVLETLATTPSLDRDTLDDFYPRSMRVIASEPHWIGIILTDASGRRLLDTHVTGFQRPILDRELIRRVVSERTPVVSNLTRDQNGSWVFAVAVPVIRDRVVRYVLSALIAPEAIRDVLTRQEVPPDWLLSVVDGAGQRVARSREHEATVGKPLPESTQALLASGAAEGYGVSYSVERERLLTPYSRLRLARWTAVLGMPTSVADYAEFRSLAFYGGGILLSIALGTLAAVWVARTITVPIAGLRRAAEALGRRQAPLPTFETPIREIREVHGTLIAASDQLAKGEAEREELLRKERLARETAEAADRAKDQFMAVLSHELRTPLNAIYGWARMLQGGQLRDSSTVARAVDAIVRNADMQVQLIDDLLDLARITSGKLRLDVRPVDIHSVVQAGIDSVRPAADAKGIRLRTTIDPAARPIAGDPARLQQVVWNLLMNAVKFTPKGGDVHVRVEYLPSSLQIVVSDTGQGIDPVLLPQLFERFRQADSSSTRSHGGLGLGLSLVKHLVELHGGTVTGHSEGIGHGATFTVALPIPDSEPGVEEGLSKPLTSVSLANQQNGARLDGLRILVTDDDGDGLAIAEAILKSAGAEVRTCLSAHAAIDVVRLWRPDVLVSDIEMPGEDGYSLIKNVRALDPAQGGRTPAIALTAYGRAQDRKRCLAAGFDLHVPKPVDPRELTSLISGVAGRADRSEVS